MQIVYHIGANRTDDERLLRSLLKNSDTLLDQGIYVPQPSRYRRLLRETIKGLDGATPPAETRDILIDAIVDKPNVSRVVMSNDRFMCVHRRIFDDGIMYTLGDEKFIGMNQLFPEDEIEYFLSIRNPATWLPDLFESIADAEFEEFLQGMALPDIRWSDFILRATQLAPNAKFTVWCDEDTPFIWAQLLRMITRVSPSTRINGGYDLLSELITDDGMKRFANYLRSHPPKTELQKRRIISAFLEKYAKEAKIEQEIDLPGWTQETVDFLTHQYDEDVKRIQQIQGVTFIAP